MTENAVNEASGAPADDAALLRIVRGEPTPEELAALVAVLAVASGAERADPAAEELSAWTDRSRYVRGALPHTLQGWRASAFPR